MSILAGSSPMTRAAQSMPRWTTVLGLGHVEIGRDVAERGKDVALAVELLPDDRHDLAGDPGRVLAREGRRGQDLLLESTCMKYVFDFM